MRTMLRFECLEMALKIYEECPSVDLWRFKAIIEDLTFFFWSVHFFPRKLNEWKLKMMGLESSESPFPQADFQVSC